MHVGYPMDKTLPHKHHPGIVRATSARKAMAHGTTPPHEPETWETSMKNDCVCESRRTLLAKAAGLGSALALPRSWAQGSRWPDRSLRFIVGFPAGTSPDLLARLLGEPLSAEFGQPCVVENRPGASGNVSAGVLAKANDRHTFGIVSGATLTSAPALYSDPGFKLTDFAPITIIGGSPQLLVTSPKIAFNGVTEFLAIARQAGNKWSYGSPGVGSNGHLSFELLKQRTGIEAVHVPYTGAPAILTSIVGGDLQMALLPIGNAMAQVQAGRIKAVAVTSLAPSTLAPGIPTLSESGVKDFSIETWNAVMAPATIPPEILTVFGNAVRRIIKTDEIRQKLFAQGWLADGGSAEELLKRITEDSATYSRIVAQRGIRIEK
jgi:tripartite-type tricarboxylate transporter receptor subunit TctC